MCILLTNERILGGWLIPERWMYPEFFDGKYMIDININYNNYFNFYLYLIL